MVTMLYHPNGKKRIWGILCKTIVVDDLEVDKYLSDGWFKTPLDFNKKPQPKTRRKVVKDEDKG